MLPGGRKGKGGMCRQERKEGEESVGGKRGGEGWQGG